MRFATHLGFGELETLGEILPLGAHHVVIPFELLLELEELRGREGGADPLRLPVERVAHQQSEARAEERICFVWMRGEKEGLVFCDEI